MLLGWSALSLAAVVISTQNRVDADPIRYFAEGHPLRVAFELVSTSVGSSTGFEVVVDSGRPDGAKDPDFLSKVDGFERWIEELPEVTTAVSLLDNLKQTHRALHGGRPEYYVLSNDKNTIGQELLLYTMSLPHAMDVNHRITMNHDALRITVLWAIGSSTEALAAIDRIESKGRSLGLAVTTTGKYQLFQRLEGHVLDSFLSSVTIALILVSGILMLCVRSIRLGMLALLANVVPLVIGGAILWLIGGTLNIGTVLVISVCLGIAVDDTVSRSLRLSAFGSKRLFGCGSDQQGFRPYRSDAARHLRGSSDHVRRLRSVYLHTLSGLWCDDGLYRVRSLVGRREFSAGAAAGKRGARAGPSGQELTSAPAKLDGI